MLVCSYKLSYTSRFQLLGICDVLISTFKSQYHKFCFQMTFDFLKLGRPTLTFRLLRRQKKAALQALAVPCWTTATLSHNDVYRIFRPTTSRNVSSFFSKFGDFSVLHCSNFNSALWKFPKILIILVRFLWVKSFSAWQASQSIAPVKKGAGGLTGDAGVDNDIMAFMRAREAILRRSQK